MGMYTIVNASIPLNEVGLQLQRELTAYQSANTHPDIEAWSLLQWDWAKEYGEDERADFIPFGILGGNARAQELWGEDRFQFVEDGRWVFLCGVKNYSCTVNKFARLILPNIIRPGETVQFLSWHETCDNPEQWVWNEKEQAFQTQKLEINVPYEAPPFGGWGE